MSGVVVGFGFSQDTGDRMSIAGALYELPDACAWMRELDEAQLDSVRELVACGFRRGVEVAEAAQELSVDVLNRIADEVAS